jgi:ribose/xylose/arabinose/galactoside ABC-type transport system permease subunit
MNKISTKIFMREQALSILFVFFIVIMIAIKPNFVSLSNANNILIDTSIYGVAALAMTIAIITGAFDLSLAVNFAWGQIFFCYLLNQWGSTSFGIFGAFMVMLLSCTLIGCVNGLIVVLGNIPPFIVTLGTMTMIKGGCLLFTGGNMISTSNEFIKAMGKGTFFGISYLTYIFIFVALLAYFLMKYTRFGRNLYATGGNYRAAELCGIPVRLCRFSIFAILGFSAGLSGAMFVCLMRAGSVLYGTDLSLTCVAATVIGGTPLSGGEGSVLKTVVGVLLIFVLYKGLAFLGLQGYYNTMIRGIVLLIVVAGNAYMNTKWKKLLH